MKKLIVFSVIAFGALSCSSQTSAEISLAGFEWLLGKWEGLNSKPGQVAYEQWTKESGTRFSGTGWTLKGKDTVFVEKLSLEIKDNAVFYVANVSHNAGPVSFKVIEQSGESFTCSNPAHDFPKQITYKKEGNELSATISGDGKSIPFKFRKVE